MCVKSFVVTTLFLISSKRVHCQIANEENSGVDLSSLGNTIGFALEAYNPCDDRFITMEREIGRPPEVENYWDGSIDLKLYKKYISEARLTLTLDHPAKLTLDPNRARISTLIGNSFSITPFGVPDYLKFTVQAPANSPFPNIESVTLNGVGVCKNISKWSPTLLGEANEAVAAPLLPQNYVRPNCGRKILDHTALVTKGIPTKPGDWPWHVALYLNSNSGSAYRCGGTVISQSYILTAAHCAVSRSRPIKPDKLLVVLGKYFLDKKDAHSVEIGVSQVIIHPNFNRTSLKNDIAIMKLAFSALYNEYVQPVCMWHKYNINKEKIWGRPGTVVGWGTNENDTLSSILQVGTMAVVSDTTCLLSFPNFFTKFVSETSFCAGNGPTNGTSVCNSDSGGALLLPLPMKDDKVAWFIRGIVSVSVARPDKDLCDPKHYIVFTDVAQYIDWIYENTDLIESLVPK